MNARLYNRISTAITNKDDKALSRILGIHRSVRHAMRAERLRRLSTPPRQSNHRSKAYR